MSAKILIVEDERDIQELFRIHLEREGHQVRSVENGEEGLKLLETQSYDLLLLDWMLPGLSGLEVCKKLRQHPQLFANPSIPILMVTARAEGSDIVLGLEMGADDYLTKPFDLPVFSARVRALLRRKGGELGETQVTLGNLTLNSETYHVTCAGEALHLTPSEFRLLHALAKNRGRVLTRERLIELVQGIGVTVIDRTIDTHIFGLRKKLGNCAEIVETIRGVGYRVRNE